MAAGTSSKDIVRNFFDTLSTGDLERVRPLFHPDATWRVMPKDIPGAGTYTPRDVIIDDFLAPIRGIFVPGDPKVVIDNMICEGDSVAAETRGVGKFQNGKEYNNTYCWVIEVKDGLIHYIREYMDSHHVAKLMED